MQLTDLQFIAIAWIAITLGIGLALIPVDNWWRRRAARKAKSRGDAWPT